MIKLNLYLFGGKSSADQFDNYDQIPDNGMVDFSVGRNTYSMPKKLFKNVGPYNNRTADKVLVAAYYAAYQAQTGKDPMKQAIEAGHLSRHQPETYEYIINEIIKPWSLAQGKELIVPAGYNYLNLAELNMKDKSYQKGITTALQMGSVKINDQRYDQWKDNQPHLQPGYVEGLGAPVGRTKDGVYIYSDSTGTYKSADGEAITDFTNATSVDGRPVVFDQATRRLVDPETGREVTGTRGPEGTPLDEAWNDYDKYYNDVWSQKEGSLGKKILDNNTSLYEKEASNAQILADTSVQGQALAQAQGIKQITDSLRAERMAQLRAGMSESQLADRELQMLMSTTGQFNTQSQMAGQESLAASMAGTTAREMAFNDYITQGTALGQNAAANYASQVGDSIKQAEEYRRKVFQTEGRTITIGAALDHVTAQKEPPKKFE